MKQLQKLVLPLLLLAAIFIIYQFYFATGGLGSFDDFDSNNSAVKTITVKFIKAVELERSGNNIVFYVQDKNEKIMQVNTSSVLPDGFASAETVTLKGHLSKNSFHAHEILVD